MAQIQTTPKINPIYRQRLERVRLAINQSSGRSALPEWMLNNLRSPKDANLPWSFKDHEYQIGILACEAPHIAVKKSSQVGVSEMSAREILGLMSLIPGSHWIYSLQTTGYARKFTTGRFDPVVEASPLLSKMSSKEVNSMEQKKIGTSFLYMIGAQKTGQAISIPCRGVIRDEVDFCNQTALTALLSRLTHNDPGTEILQDFSTPTLPDYGIDETHGQGTQRVYMVYHQKCGQWTVVDPAFDIVLPGFDQDLLTLVKADLEDHRVRPNKSYVKCRCCGNEITRDNLMDARLRAWVPKYPDKPLESFYVSPLDVPRYNPPEKIILAVKNYKRADDWINFGLGHAHLPVGAAVSKEAAERAAVGAAVPPGRGAGFGWVGGMDVGKTCYLTAMQEIGGKFVVKWLERIRQEVAADGTDTVSTAAIERSQQYGMRKFVVDGGPDVTIPKRLIAGMRYQVAWAAYFARSIKGLDNFSLKEAEQMVTVARTAMIDDLVKDINDGRFIFPRSPETELLIKHLRKLKRAKRISETTGDETAVWVSSDPDNHYAFSLLYAYTAAKMSGTGVGEGLALSPEVIVAKARVPGLKTGTDQDNMLWPTQ